MRGLAAVVGWMDRVHLDDAQRRLAGRYTQDASGLIEGSVMAVLQVVIAVFILYHFLKDRSAVLDGVRRVLPLSRPEADRVFGRVADSVHANLYATLVTSLIDGVGGGLLFWALGLPAPVTWGLVMFVISGRIDPGRSILGSRLPGQRPASRPTPPARLTVVTVTF